MISCATGTASCCACMAVTPGFSRPTILKFQLPAPSWASQAHRHPEFASIQLARNQRKFKVARHHADDLVWFAIKQNLVSQNVGSP